MLVYTCSPWGWGVVGESGASESLLQGQCERRKVTFSLHHKGYTHTDKNTHTEAFRYRASLYQTPSLTFCCFSFFCFSFPNTYRGTDTLTETSFIGCSPQKVTLSLCSELSKITIYCESMQCVIVIACVLKSVSLFLFQEPQFHSMLHAL